MNRLITVKGTGNVSAKPDLIIITMNIESHQYDYEKTMELAADSVNILQEAIKTVGFEKKDMKKQTLALGHITRTIMTRIIIIRANLMGICVNKD